MDVGGSSRRDHPNWVNEIAGADSGTLTQPPTAPIRFRANIAQVLASAGRGRERQMRRLASAATAVLFCSLLALRGPAAYGQEPGTNGRIAFTREIPNRDDRATFTIDPDGTDAAPLLRGSEVPRWSPDGTEIAVLSCQNPPDCTTAETIVDPDTGEVVRWFEFSDPDLFTACFVWSPDGNRLACGAFGDTDPSLNGIYSIDAADGTDLTRITSNPGGEDSPGDYSPDGGRIVFLRADPDRPERRSQALFITEVDGTARPQRVTPWGLSEETGSWSPDGNTILFAGAGVLYTVPADGGQISRIRLGRRGGAFDPVWSPNGRKIAFGFFAEGERQSDIWIARTNGRGMHPVTRTKRSEHFPDWGSHPTT
jgi:Tol biopolymer transport system component